MAKKSKSPVKKSLTVPELQTKADALRRKATSLEQEAIRLQFPSECRKAAKEISKRDGNVAVFLGAGASKTFGWPLTSQLLPLILDGLIDEDLFEDVRINDDKQNAADRRRLEKALQALCPGIQFSKAFLESNSRQLPLVTSLLSILDYSLSSGQVVLSGFSSDEIKDARELLERAIYESIEHVEVEVSPNNWPARTPNEYTRQLAKWLDTIRPKKSNVGVITSNYDAAIEQVWGFDRDDPERIEGLALDFGFDWIWPSNSVERTIKRPAVPNRRLYKLHGSTNWLRCGLCDRTYINPEVDIAVYAYERRNKLSNSCHCGHARLEVQIVSPSFVREMRAPNLITVWQQALDWLRQASDWIIIGYSFPDEDLNIRSLFTRALASGKKPPPHVTAIQLGGEQQIRTRYEVFFPQDRLTFLEGGLNMFLDNVSKH